MKDENGLAAMLTKRNVSAKTVVYGALILLTVFTLGRCTAGGSKEGTSQPKTQSLKPKASLWTCSMHPQIKLPKPGQCPICFMDLIPLESGGDDSGPRELTISAASAKLMELETAPAERRFVSDDVRMVGKIDYDETRVEVISSWIPGRIDRLFVDYTGVPVKTGDHLAELYSPELVTAQEELLQAVRTLDNMKNSPSDLLKNSSERTIEAIREKLRLWGFSTEQIRTIEERGAPTDHMTITSPASGIVIHKDAKEGMYVQTGTKIYTIADLSKVWIQLDAYESDLNRLRYGGDVEFTVEAYPGETFRGTISFIDPVITPGTRTFDVRVIADNQKLKLKPGMFVRAVARSHVAEDGRVMNPDLAGKWISPMHPEIVKDGPGTCDVCGMPLVPAESLGYTADETANAPLVIPASAPLLTGKRAVVYVEVPNREKPTYEGREIVLGPRVGNFYIVKEGLNEGERVVINGAFKLDAELQIQAKPSMMTPMDGGHDESHQQHKTTSSKPVHDINPEFKKQLGALTKEYLTLQSALAQDDAAAAVEAARQAQKALADVDMSLVTGEAHMEWMQFVQTVKPLLENIAAAEEIEPIRTQFSALSNQLSALLSRFGAPDEPLYKAWCPMALDNRGASWIQTGEQISNPYFGDAMLRCGEIQEELK